MSDLFRNHIVGFPTRRLIYETCNSLPCGSYYVYTMYMLNNAKSLAMSMMALKFCLLYKLMIKKLNKNHMIRDARKPVFRVSDQV